MPAHGIYPKVDARPAGFSGRWLNDIPRGELGFAGCIFSDDFSMAGARLIDGQEVGYIQDAAAALTAGCDMVLLCNQSVGNGQPVDELIDGLTEAQLKGQWQPSDVSELRRYALLPQTPALEWDALMINPRLYASAGLVALTGLLHCD